jgi:predicted metallopeptidase
MKTIYDTKLLSEATTFILSIKQVMTLHILEAILKAVQDWNTNGRTVAPIWQLPKTVENSKTWVWIGVEWHLTNS